MESIWNIFIGDLASTATDSDVWNAFSKYESLVSARVVMDPISNKSKGYGFVSFSLENEAERVLSEMNGARIKDRDIRVNWAVQKVSQRSLSNFNKIFHSTPSNNTTVYIGNIPGSIIIYDSLTKLLGEYGYVLDLKICNGFAFAKMDSHHSAALSILKLNGTVLDGSILRVSWGREKYNWQNIIPPMIIPYPYIYNNTYFAYPNLIQPMVNMYDQTEMQEEKENIQS